MYKMCFSDTCGPVADASGSSLIPRYQNAAQMEHSVKCRFNRARRPRVNRAYPPTIVVAINVLLHQKKQTTNIFGGGGDWRERPRLPGVSAMTSSPSATPATLSSRCRLRRDIFLTPVTSDKPRTGSRTCTPCRHALYDTPAGSDCCS